MVMTRGQGWGRGAKEDRKWGHVIVSTIKKKKQVKYIK